MIKRFIKEQSGNSSIEYGLIGVAIASAIVFIVDDSFYYALSDLVNHMSSHSSNTENLLGI